jgi:hypothetical protein
MGWLDANEIYVMEAVARDRVEELRCSALLAASGADGAGAAGGGPSSGNAGPADAAIEICRGPRAPRRLGAPRLAC